MQAAEGSLSVGPGRPPDGTPRPQKNKQLKIFVSRCAGATPDSMTIRSVVMKIHMKVHVQMEN